MVRLFCAIVGAAGSAFEVKIDDAESVSALKEAIQAKNATTITGDAKDLQLFLAKKAGGVWLHNNDPGVPELEEGRIHANVQELINGEKMTANWTIKDVFDANHMPTPQSRQIHVLVALPPGTSSAPISDGTDLWLTRFLHNAVTNITSLPTRGDLNEFIGRPLPVKIGLPQSVLQAWSSPVILGQVLRGKLFEVNDVSPCQHLERSVFSNAFLYPQVDGDATESAFHYFWDSIIRVVLGFVFHGAYVNRDSSRKSSSGLKRPDFLFALDHVCVFRGEEKEPRASITVPREELSKKLEWSYGGVPYIFGYAAAGFELELFAIYQDVEKRAEEENPKNIVTTHRIAGFNLQQAPERFRLVLALLNLCLLFPVIVRNCPASARTDFMNIYRGNGVKVRLSPTFVDKIFPTQEEYRRVKLIYDSLKPFEIPCADAVVAVDSDQLRLTLMPRGIEMKPCSLSELFVALRNVLEALVVLHRNGWMHRDIRWSNVIKRIDRVEWYLIDFADAAQSPQNYPSGDHLAYDEHASEIFVEGGFHTTAVDLWAVGYLVKTSKVEQEWIAAPERGLFLDRLMNTDPIARPTADEALQHLSRIEREAEQESQNKAVRKKHRHA